MQLNHEILSEKLVEDKLVGMSIIMIEDVVQELRDDPDFQEDVYRSILVAELQTIPKEMKDTCRMCQLEDERPCCDSDCKLFKKAVEYHEMIDSEYDICYHCPERDKGCLGYDYCMYRNLTDSLQVKDVKMTADELLWKGIISEELFIKLCDSGLRYINAFDYQAVLDVVGSEVILKVQREFLILMERSFSEYLSGLNEVLGLSRVKTSKSAIQFEKDFQEYLEAKRVNKHKEEMERFSISLKSSRVSESFFGVLIDKKTKKAFKLIIRKNYISSEVNLPERALELIADKIREDFDKHFQLPGKVYLF